MTHTKLYRKAGRKMIYTECPECGAHLDPCEKCDCAKMSENEQNNRTDETTE